jgi:cytoskeletal protein RodZ
MADLRTERERRGLSLREVSRVSQIPLQILVALEDGDTDRMAPEDLFHYREKYERHLGIRPQASSSSQGTRAEPEIVEPGESTRTLTVPIEDEFPRLRLVIIGFLLTLATVMILQVGSMLVDRQSESPILSEGQELSLRAVNAIKVRLHSESNPQPEQTLEAGESTSLRSTETIIVEVENLTEVVIYYNGEMIHPLGDQEFPRRLVFVRDAEE